MQVDHSKNYKNSGQNEIHSAYFGHSCFSIFTACCYYRTEEEELMTYPITITSESSDHSRIAAFSCVNKMLKVMEERINPINKSLLGATDWGHSFVPDLYLSCFQPSTKQLMLSGIVIKSTMVKGLMDGVGGTIKNLVFGAVKSAKVSVRDPEEFAKATNNIVPSLRSH